VRKEPVDSGFDFLVAESFPSVSLLDSSPDGGPETHVFRHDSQCGVSDQLFGIGAAVNRDLREVLFLFRSEAHFHGSHDSGFRLLAQPGLVAAVRDMKVEVVTSLAENR
jgi:hypothetical protein